MFYIRKSILICILIIAGTVAVAGCTSDSSSDIIRQESNVEYTTKGDHDSATGYGWKVSLPKSTNSSYFQGMTEKTALANVTDKDLYDNKEEWGTELLDSGTKTIEGITVYYNKFNYFDVDGSFEAVEGTILFNKDGQWYRINWSDRPLQANQEALEKEIAFYINNAGSDIPVDEDYTN